MDRHSCFLLFNAFNAAVFGRRLAMFHDMDEVKSKGKVLQRVIKKWLTLLDTK
jgi:hypothetical protein